MGIYVCVVHICKSKFVLRTSISFCELPCLFFLLYQVPFLLKTFQKNERYYYYDSHVSSEKINNLVFQGFRSTKTNVQHSAKCITYTKIINCFQYGVSYFICFTHETRR